jgi:[acyl-carrier-protein] S-malonyltransferase
MQEAVPAGTGAMAAIIGLDNADVEMICKAAVHSAEEVISPANYNSPGQIVVAGHKAPVLRAMQLAKEKGAKLVIPLPVSVPSHCLLMQPAASHLQKFLSEVTFKMPSITLINNVNAKPYDTIEAIKAGLVKQLYSPVRWVETIQFFINAQVTRILECGPGKVLSGLNKRIDKNLILKTTSDVMGAKHVS